MPKQMKQKKIEMTRKTIWINVKWIGEPTEGDVKTFLREEFPEEVFNLNRTE